MLYGSDDQADGDGPGLAHEIDALVNERVQIALDLLECMDGILSERCGSEEKRQLVVRQNKLEAALFDFSDKVDQVTEGIEDDFCSTSAKLEPALRELGLQFD